MALLQSEDGRVLARWSAHATETTALAFSPDSKRLAALGTNGLLKVFDTETHDELLTLRDLPQERFQAGVEFVGDQIIVRAGEEAVVFDPRPAPEDVRRRRDRSDAARKLLKEVWDLTPLDEDRRRLLQAHGNVDEAVRAAAVRMLDFFPEHPLQLNERAWPIVANAASSAADVASAVRWAEAAVAHDPDAGDIVNTLGVAYYLTGSLASSAVRVRNSLSSSAAFRR